MIGETISHYKIIEKLGEGGMGVVYKAQDTTLDRFVAIKFLPPHLSKDEEATKRFIHEAKAASALDHANIGTIHEVDKTSDGRTFIVMAHYEGETLRQRIDRGTVAVEEAIRITSQVAAGLAKAHEKEIVHRDIKPSNILITRDGEAKIIDFGLAKLRGRTRLTKEGSTLGTAAYMSPEQARGEEVDNRSDIFSLGSILYEMLAGEPPFKGEHEAALLYEIVHEEPEPLARYRSDIPQGLQNIVDKAVQKNSSDRYQNANDMLSDMKGIFQSTEPVTTAKIVSKGMSRSKFIAAGIASLVFIAALVIVIRHFASQRVESPTERIMIAVLPFANLGSPKDEYFSDGITDAITARLVGISGLGVIARQSVIQYKNSDKSIQTIAKELGGVEYILEGTVQRERPSDHNSKVRIIPQLIRTADGIHLWADTYDEEMINVFEIQSDIAERVVEELNVVILGEERQALRVKITENLQAYDYYLQGREYEERGIEQNATEVSIELYHRAIEADSNFAEAYARLALQRCRLYWHAWDTSVEQINMAKEAIGKALRLKPEEPLVRAANGYYYYYGLRDYAKALDEFAIAQRKEPGNAFYNSSIGFVQRRLGKFDEALQSMKIAFQYNPRSALIAYGVAGSYNDLRRYSEAEDYCNRAISLAPDIGVYYIFKAEILINKTGSTESAREALMQALDRFEPTKFAWDLTYFDIIDGRYQHALDRLESIQEEVDTRQSLYKPKDSVRGLLIELMGQPNRARKYYENALGLLKEVARERPDEARIHAELGKIYAYLGQRDNAIREAQKIVELEPISRDVARGGEYLTEVAAIYTILGDHEAAIDILESLPRYSAHAWLGYIGALKINPLWSPLHDHPRFIKLIERISYVN